MMAWNCDVSMEEKVRQDCYNRGYEQGRKNPCEEIVEYIEKLQNQVKEYQDKIEHGTLIELPRIVRIVECSVEKFVVQWEENGRVRHKSFLVKKEAEKRLKELQGE